MDPIRAIEAARAAIRPEQAAQPRPGGGAFAEHVREAMGQTNKLLIEADRAAVDATSGAGDVVDAVLALSKAEVALRHAVTMSSRMLEAYREVMRLQL